MAAVSKVGQGAVWGSVLLVVFGLSCAEPRSTQPSAGDLAFAKGGGSDPTVTSANPSEARQDTTLDVHVIGSNYDQGTKVDFARAGVVDPKLHVNSTTYLSSTELRANVSVAADAAPVSYDVMVTKSTGKKGIGTERFAVLVPAEVELLSAPAGGADVRGASNNGLLAGRIASTCGIGRAPALWDQTGQLTSLPYLPGTCGGTAMDVNSTGVVVGFVYTGSSISNDVRWVLSGGTYQVEALPRLPNGALAGAWAVNEAGFIVGSNTASFWSEATGWIVLQRPAGATTCLGQISLSDAAAIVGSCQAAGKRQAVYWGSPTASPVVLPLPVGGSDPSAWDVNDAGTIVGSALIGTKKGVRRAIRWAPSGGTWVPEILPDLGAGSSAMAINDVGQIVGTLSSNKPVFWDAYGMYRLLEGTGDALGLSDAVDGPVVAGYTIVGHSTFAARWRP